jgi:hypothetical protein
MNGIAAQRRKYAASALACHELANIRVRCADVVALNKHFEEETP